MIKKIKIANRVISEKSPPLVVAEISANHKNSLKNTFKLMTAAANAGIEAIKFQTFKTEEMTLNLKKNEFVIKNTFKNKSWNKRSLFSIYKESHLPFEWHKKIFDKAKSLGLICFSSVFDKYSLSLLEKLNVPAYKIASLESLHFPLIADVAKTKKPIIISTGTLEKKEIEKVINFFKKIKYRNYLILHCVSQYPAKYENTNLKFISYLRKKYNCLIGFSDHTPDLGASIASVGFGASLIEKHFKLNKNDKTLDSNFSLSMNEMKILVKEVKNAWLSIGSSTKKISKAEKIVKKYRRSIYACEKIEKGSKLTIDNIKIIRPGFGLAPENYYKILGKKAKKIIKAGEPINKEKIKI